jgi:hypothetical protein
VSADSPAVPVPVVRLSVPVVRISVPVVRISVPKARQPRRAFQRHLIRRVLVNHLGTGRPLVYRARHARTTAHGVRARVLKVIRVPLTVPSSGVLPVSPCCVPATVRSRMPHGSACDRPSACDRWIVGGARLSMWCTSSLPNCREETELKRAHNAACIELGPFRANLTGWSPHLHRDRALALLSLTTGFQADTEKAQPA